jgi:hypothetical protein
VKSYIVRIYRQGDKENDETVGIVEDTESKERRSFKSMDELCKTLRSVKKRTKYKKTTEEGGE